MVVSKSRVRMLVREIFADSGVLCFALRRLGPQLVRDMRYRRHYEYSHVALLYALSRNNVAVYSLDT